MKFSTRRDIDLGAEALFRAVSDFNSIERLFVRRGASVCRLDDLDAPGVGMRWLIGFNWRGQHREITAELAQLDVPEVVVITGNAEQFDLMIRVTVVALTPEKSRLIFETEVHPRSMKARLLLQTAKLGKAQLDRKFTKKVGEFIAHIASGERA
ncbi:SRPBCC family protein [Paracoccus methylovorus]|uniref:SRPBCC family protein n=1 Tax=Paracoccus methylovorus TaxID=2812658 RepID=A0ABX7JI36_9RHOB|nr:MULTISPECIES: SRPBCC family protein [Paracoccus]QRZ13900.1 SRPBCC family protein [Paracoccus methylovorus]